MFIISVTFGAVLISEQVNLSAHTLFEHQLAPVI